MRITGRGMAVQVENPLRGVGSFHRRSNISEVILHSVPWNTYFLSQEKF